MLESGILVAVIVGLAQLIKGLGVDTKFIPLFNVVLGVVFSAFIAGFSVDGVIQGLIIGLSASGLYDNFKSIKGGK